MRSGSRRGDARARRAPRRSTGGRWSPNFSKSSRRPRTRPATASVDGQGACHLLGRRRRGPSRSRSSRSRHGADRRLLAVRGALEPAHDPGEHAGVLAVAGPQELAVLVLAEPVHPEDARQLSASSVRSVIDEPVPEVVAHVVAAERQHRERVVAQLAEAAERGRGLLGAHGGADEHAVAASRATRTRAGPSSRGDHRRGSPRSARPSGPPTRRRSTGHCDAGAREAGVRVRGRGLGRRASSPGAFQSVRCAGGSPSMPSHQTSPSSVQRDVGEDGVLVSVRHRVRVRLVVRARRDAEEPDLGVDRAQPAVVAELHPGDVVADRLDLPTRDATG